MTEEAFPASGRLAGIDYGTVRIGIAITNSERTLASPFENYNRQSLEQDAEHFRRFVRSEEVVGIVIGLPVHSDGLESAKSLETRRFGQWLHEATGLPVQYYDERYTSLQAERSLYDARMTRKKRKKRLDMLAAQIMLAGFLESSSDDPPGALDD